MSKNSIIPFLKDYLINFLTSPFLLDTNDADNLKNILFQLFPYRKLQSSNLLHFLKVDVDNPL